jgi:Vilmaviridae nuclease
LVAYTDRHAIITTAAPNSAVHFFLDDYRFETVWSKPERGLSRCQTVGAALTPDFSLWTDMPVAMQLWQVYRSRWCGAWLLHHGIRVIPTVSWSTPDSYPFAFAGIPTRSVVAVSTVGVVRDRQARALFAAGFTAMVDQLQPSTVLVYGKPPTEQVPEGTVVRCYPSRWAGQ